MLQLLFAKRIYYYLTLILRLTGDVINQDTNKEQVI